MGIYNRVLITGGGGMLARALVQSLVARGISPHLFTRGSLDVSSVASTAAAFDRVEPTLILNCAAFTKVDLCEEQSQTAHLVNGSGARVVGMGALAYGAKVIHFSTDFVFDGTASRPYVVSDTTNALSEYGQSKLAGERELQQIASLDHLIIRTAWLYGPGGPNFVQTMLNLARAGKPIRVVDDQIGAPTFTQDLAQATLKLIDCGATGIWHVTNAGQTSWFGFAQAIFEEFNLKADLQPISSADWKKLKPNSATRPAYSVLDIEPYAKLTGTPMRHWREALRAYREMT